MNIPEECQRSIDLIASRAREFLSEGKELQAFAFLGKFGKGFFPFPMEMSNKDIAVKLVTALCKDVEADYIIMISEAWALSGTCPNEELERLAKTRESIAKHPDRMDIVMVTLETQQGTWMCQSQIKSLGGKKRGFDDLQFIKFDRMEGRFASFLPRGTQH
jgi:hypothetical protein